MVKIENYKNLRTLLDFVDTEIAYASSIVEGYQSGEIFVDNHEHPKAALFWHYCGFANLVGEYDEAIIKDVLEMMQHPLPNHSHRLCLHTKEDKTMEKIFSECQDVYCGLRYVFEYAVKHTTIPYLADTVQLKKIDKNNYNLLKGNIIPAFSWESQKAFLEKGFGYCIIENNRALACAFSSAVCEKYVDIGVETLEAARGKGYGKMVADAMVKEIISQGKTPVWACDVKNEASRRLAVSVGFHVLGTHPWYKI